MLARATTRAPGRCKSVYSPSHAHLRTRQVPAIAKKKSAWDDELQEAGGAPPPTQFIGHVWLLFQTPPRFGLESRVASPSSALRRNIVKLLTGQHLVDVVTSFKNSTSHA